MAVFWEGQNCSLEKNTKPQTQQFKFVNSSLCLNAQP